MLGARATWLSWRFRRFGVAIDNAERLAEQLQPLCPLLRWPHCLCLRQMPEQCLHQWINAHATPAPHIIIVAVVVITTADRNRSAIGGNGIPDI